MKRIFQLLVLSIVVLNIGMVQLAGGPAGHVSIRDLTTQADAVVVGTLVQQVQTGGGVALDIDVARVVKGNVAPQQRLHVSWEAASGRRTTGSAPEEALWFLKASGQQWVILSPMVGDVDLSTACLPLSAGATARTVVYANTKNAVDNVVNEITNEIEASSGSSPLSPMLLAGALNPDDTTSSTYQAYARFVQSGSANVRGLGLQALIKAGNMGALSQFLNDKEILTLKALPMLANAICDFRNTTPTATAVLGQVANQSDVPLSIRGCAAHALRAIHTPAALPYLAQLLESPEFDVRYEAVAGLASFATNLPVQNK